MKLQAFTSATTGQVQNRALTVLKALEEEFGIKVAAARGKYNAANATLTFTFSTISASGTVETPEATAFKMYARTVGLAPTDLHRQFTLGRDRYKVIGFKTRATKLPIIAVNIVDNRRYKFSADTVKLALTREQ